MHVGLRPIVPVTKYYYVHNVHSVSYLHGIIYHPKRRFTLLTLSPNARVANRSRILQTYTGLTCEVCPASLCYYLVQINQQLQ